MAEYVEISKDEMIAAMSAMGFVQHEDIPGVQEMVFERDVITKSGKAYPYRVRVYSSVPLRGDVSRPVGSDAIKVVLIDDLTNRPAKRAARRVNRTKNALANLRLRCREEFAYVLTAPTCPRCASIMVERTNWKTNSQFLACSRYAPNTPHHCTKTMPMPESPVATS